MVVDFSAINGWELPESNENGRFSTLTRYTDVWTMLLEMSFSQKYQDIWRKKNSIEFLNLLRTTFMQRYGKLYFFKPYRTIFDVCRHNIEITVLAK